MNENGIIIEFVGKLKKDLPPLLGKFPSVLSAYLFGSSVQGAVLISSDVDIAVRIDNNLTSEQAFDLRLQLIDELENHLGKRVDVVVLNSASLKLVHQVIGNGVMIFAMDPRIEQDYAVQKQKEYFDFKYYIEKDVEELRTFFGQ